MRNFNSVVAMIVSGLGILLGHIALAMSLWRAFAQGK